MCLNNVHKRHSSRIQWNVWQGNKRVYNIFTNISMMKYCNGREKKNVEEEKKFATTKIERGKIATRKNRENIFFRKIREETYILEHEEHNLCCIFSKHLCTISAPASFFPLYPVSPPSSIWRRHRHQGMRHFCAEKSIKQYFLGSPFFPPSVVGQCEKIFC